MEYRVEFDRHALDQIERVYERNAEHAPQAAARWYAGVFKQIESLKAFPRRCPVAPESRSIGAEVRELLYGKRHQVYRILYGIHDDVICIYQIWHSSKGSTHS